MFIQKHFKLWEGTEFDSVYPIIFTGIKKSFKVFMYGNRRIFVRMGANRIRKSTD